MHGGASPQVREAAERRLERMRLEGLVAALVGQLDLDGLDDPLVAMRDSLATAVAMRGVIAELVGELGLTPSTAGESGEGGAGALFGPDHLGDLRQHPLVVMLREWTTSAAQLSKLSLELDIDRLFLRREEAFSIGQAQELFTLVVEMMSRLRVELAERGVDEATLGEVMDGRFPKVARAVLEDPEMLERASAAGRDAAAVYARGK